MHICHHTHLPIGLGDLFSRHAIYKLTLTEAVKRLTALEAPWVGSIYLDSYFTGRVIGPTLEQLFEHCAPSNTSTYLVHPLK